MTSSYALRRARIRTTALVALGSVVALATCGLSVLLGASGPLIDTGVREAFRASEPTAAAVRITARLADDPEAQDDAVREAIARATRDLPVEVTRTLRTDAAPVVVADAAAPALLMSTEDLPALAELVDGAWSTSSDEVMVQADAAAALGLRVGGGTVIDGRLFTVAGTWAARDPAAPTWFGDPSVGSGEEEGVTGPVVLDDGALAALPGSTDARWTVVPTVESLDAAALSAMPAAVDRLAEEVRVLGRGDAGGVALTGELDRRATGLGAAVLASAAVLAVPLVLISLLGVIVLAVVLRSLVEARGAETALLRARGASVTRLVLTATCEAVLVGLCGAVAGSGLGAAVVAGIASWSDAVDAVPVTVAVAASSVGVVAAIAAILNLLGARNPGIAMRDDGRRAGVVAVIPLTVAILLAGLSLTQFLVRGSPLAAEAQRVDPLAVAAPTLVLVALALSAPVVAGPVFAALEALARGTSGILPVLPLRQVTRRVRSVASAVVAVALASGAAMVASAYEGGSAAAERLAVRGETGADLRVRYDELGVLSERLAGLDISAVAAARGVDSALAVTSSDVEVGPDRIPAIAADPLRLATLTSDPDLSRLAPRLVERRTAIALPDDATELRIGLAVRGEGPVSADAGLVVVAWLLDRDGAPRRAEVGRLPVVQGDARVPTLSAAVPSPRSLLALEYEATSLPDGASLTVSLAALGVDDEEIEWSGDAEARVDSDSPQVRLLARPAGEALPVVVTAAFASRFDVGPGDPLSVRAGARPLPSAIAGVVPRIPGVTNDVGVLVDSETLAAAQLAVGSGVPAPDEVWISSSRPEATAAVVRSELTRRAEVLSPAAVSRQPVLGPSVVLLEVGVAVALVLAICGFAAVVGSDGRSRRSEAVPLRSQGLPRRTLARARAVEVVATAAVATVLGAVAGVVTAILVVPGIVRATTGEQAIGWAVAPVLGAVAVIGAAVGASALLALRVTDRSEGR